MSDDDVELVIKIPFFHKIKLHAINIIGGEEGRAPSQVKLYKDIEAVDMSILEDYEPV